MAAGPSAAGTVQQIRWSSRLGAHLEAFRIQAGLRRIDLAHRLGVSEEAIRLWERGAVQPSEDHLVRLIPMLAIESSHWDHLEVATAGEDDELPELARRLRQERARRALTQSALAAELGVSQATYAGWETGRATPRVEHHAALAAFLDLAEATVEAMCNAPFVVESADWPPFGQLLGARRQALRLSRVELAESLGVTPRTIMSWELGHRRPQSSHITAIADRLGISSADLVALLPQRSVSSQLGALILTRQRELGLQSTDVARLVGTTEATVSRWINGRTRPAATNLRRLAQALQVSHSRLAEAGGLTS